MKIYITHYTPLIERKINIIKQLNKSNIFDFTIIENYDKESLTIDDTLKFKNINMSEISLFLKHNEIFKKEDDDIVVILEDDAILVDDFEQKLQKYITELDNYDWDILFCGECCNLHETVILNKLFYPQTFSRGTCMYILNKGVSSKINKIFNNEIFINKSIDWWFNIINPKYNLKYLWSEPTLVSQGSEIGIYKSSIR
jgi:GR25 family glycosyltransferase involved in LPS biosynthesis